MSLLIIFGIKRAEKVTAEINYIELFYDWSYGRSTKSFQLFV